MTTFECRWCDHTEDQPLATEVYHPCPKRRGYKVPLDKLPDPTPETPTDPEA